MGVFRAITGGWAGWPTWVKSVSGGAAVAVTAAGLVIGASPHARAATRAYDIDQVDVASSGATTPFGSSDPNDEPPVMSADGRFVAFLGSAGDGPPNLYVRDRLDHTTAQLADADSIEGDVQPAISADGTTVAEAALTADPSTGDDAVRLYDTATGQPTRTVQLPVAGTTSDPIYVTDLALDAHADRLAVTTLQDVSGIWAAYVIDLDDSSLTTVGVWQHAWNGAGEWPSDPQLSDDGHTLLFVGTEDSGYAETEVYNVSDLSAPVADPFWSENELALPSLSDNGEWVAYTQELAYVPVGGETDGPSTLNVVAHPLGGGDDVVLATTTSDDGSFGDVAISGAGDVVAYSAESRGTGLTSVYSVSTAAPFEPTLVSADTDDTAVEGDEPSISADGGAIAFASTDPALFGRLALCQRHFRRAPT